MRDAPWWNWRSPTLVTDQFRQDWRKMTRLRLCAFCNGWQNACMNLYLVWQLATFCSLGNDMNQIEMISALMLCLEFEVYACCIFADVLSGGLSLSFHWDEQSPRFWPREGGSSKDKSTTKHSCKISHQSCCMLMYVGVCWFMLMHVDASLCLLIYVVVYMLLYISWCMLMYVDVCSCLLRYVDVSWCMLSYV